MPNETQLPPLPEAFLKQMRLQLGEEGFHAYLSAVAREYYRGIRFSLKKPLLRNDLSLMDGVLEPIPWQKDAYYLSKESTAGLSPLHEAGACYIQEPSAMIPVSVLAPAPGEHILDLCAAPGGKSTQIADALEGEGLLVSNEPVSTRAKILSRNLERMGVANALVVSEEPEKLALSWKNLFDAALVDAPCSGEGMFRRHPETRTEWTESSPAGCSERQLRILNSASEMVRPGGRMVYSTCTFNTLENEGVLSAFLASHPDWHPENFTVPLSEKEMLKSENGMLHLYPHEIRGEGHFCALLVKDGNEEPGMLQPASECLSKPDKALLSAYAAFCRELNCEKTLPQANAQMGDVLLSSPDLPPIRGIRVLRAGCQLGVLKGKCFCPDHALAMALTPPYVLPVQEMSPEEALRYQRGETIETNQKGWMLPTCHGFALGFGKASDGQMKNHYPKGLRRP